jgi:hypothetical protein
MPTPRPILLTASLTALTVVLGAQSPMPGRAEIDAAQLKEWLTYIASDELQGREVYTEGLGLAASYIADRLKEWGVKPAVDGTYFQPVKVVSVRTTSRSSVTVAVNGQTRTFKDGEGITLPRNMGSTRTIRGDDVRFVGYGVQNAEVGWDDYADLDPRGTIVIWLGRSGPRAAGEAPRGLAGRSRIATEKGALAVIGPAAASPQGRGGGGRRGEPPADFTTAQRYDIPGPLATTAQDDFFEFLFSGAKTSYVELKALAEKREPLPRFQLNGVTLTFNVDAEYTVVTTRLSRNVVGIVEGSDPALKTTYVAFGAHYDHIGYHQTTPPAGGDNFGCPGQSRPTPRPGDIVNNGADDDGSGTVGLMAIARAFALGPRPKRSLVFVWHTAEESGLQGSRYNADHPVVPNDQILAQLNVDMIGRNRCDDPQKSNTVYLVGSDRISTDLHNISEDANASLASPMTLDYELNDPAEPQSLYTRSDHYSYAAKGIPVIFYTTGLHRDYHYVTDEIDRIDIEKLAKVTELVYATGLRLATLDRAPVRDNKGPRAGRSRSGKISAREPVVREPRRPDSAVYGR